MEFLQNKKPVSAIPLNHSRFELENKDSLHTPCNLVVGTGRAVFPPPNGGSMKTMIHTDAAPKAVGPYSQAVRAGNLLFVSGQLPLDPATMKIHGETAAEQARQALSNLGAILKAAGLDYRHVVKTTVLLADIRDFAAVNEVYAQFFTGDFPARAAYQVAALPLDAKVEIEAVASAE